MFTTVLYHHSVNLWELLGKVLKVKCCPILAWYRISDAQPFDVPNDFKEWKVWTAGRHIKPSDSSTMKPCCYNISRMWHCLAEIWPPQKKSLCLGGSVCCSKIYIYCSALLALSQMCKLPMPLLWRLAFELKADKPDSPVASIISKKNLNFGFLRQRDSFPLCLRPS